MHNDSAEILSLPTKHNNFVNIKIKHIEPTDLRYFSYQNELD